MLMLTVAAVLATCPECHTPHVVTEVVEDAAERFWTCDTCGDCHPLS